MDTHISWFASALGIAYILHACMHSCMACTRCVWLCTYCKCTRTHTHIRWFLLQNCCCICSSLDISCDHRKYISICFVVTAENDMLASSFGHCILTQHWIRIFNLNKRCWVLNESFSHSAIRLLGRLSQFELMKKPKSEDTNMYTVAAAAALCDTIDVIKIQNPMDLNWSVGRLLKGPWT